MDNRGYRDNAPVGRIDRPTADEIRKIVVDGDAQAAVEWGEKLGDSLRSSLTTSQFRSVFSTVRQIEMNWPLHAQEDQVRMASRQLILLRPKLAYQASRDARGSGGMAVLRDVLGEAIRLVGDDRGRFQHFVDFCEAILAYHTAAVR